MQQINSDIKMPIIYPVICITHVDSEIANIGQYIPNNS
jgi:hypothetical protein